MQNFANAVLFGEELISLEADGINELTLSNTAYLSEWQSNSEIILSFYSELFDKLLAEKAKSSKSCAADLTRTTSVA